MNLAKLWNVKGCHYPSNLQKALKDENARTYARKYYEMHKDRIKQRKRNHARAKANLSEKTGAEEAFLGEPQSVSVPNSPL